MQYLLTEEEFKNRVHKDEVVKRDNALALAREKLLQLAGFDCIHNAAGRNTRGYCSGCPCSPIHSGSDATAVALWSRVCWLEKNYPQ